jgi:hypothetical protein
MAEATLTIKDMKEFFGYTKLADFSKDWKELSDKDKQDIRQGLADDTYNY